MRIECFSSPLLLNIIHEGHSSAALLLYHLSGGTAMMKVLKKTTYVALVHPGSTQLLIVLAVLSFLYVYLQIYAHILKVHAGVDV